MPQENCPQLRQEVEYIKVLKAEFDKELDQAFKSGKTDKAQELRQEIETKLKSLETKLWPFEQLEQADIEKQYESQVKVLTASNLLETLSSGELGIKGVDGKEYPLPKFEEVLERLKNSEHKDLLDKKAEQGFTKLQLTPFALPLDAIIDKYKQVMLDIHQNQGGIKATDGTILELNEDDPIHIWDKLPQCDNPKTPKGKQMEYGVKTYDADTKKKRGGQYKSELLQDPTNAWQISLIEDLPDLPAEGQGQTKGNRKQLEANKTPKQYLQDFQTKKQYQGETGQTPEEALITWLTYLQEKQTAIDDWKGQGKVNWLVGSYLSGYVPYFLWSRDDCQPFLYRLSPVSSDSDDACRPSASV